MDGCMEGEREGEKYRSIKDDFLLFTVGDSS